MERQPRFKDTNVTQICTVDDNILPAKERYHYFLAGCKYRREYTSRGAVPAGPDKFYFRWQLLVQYYILLDIFLYNVKITDHTES
jgi:hypothetical protein